MLAGRSPGVELDETGRGQAEKVVGRLDGVPIAEIVCSPMVRCTQTVAPLAAVRELAPVSEPELAEVDYGSWTGGAFEEPGQGAALEGRAGAPVGGGVPRW